ncbi:MAG: hypothetical protein WDO15_15255 [Bacteroidota bacterium]
MRYFFHIGYNGFAYQGLAEIATSQQHTGCYRNTLSRVLKTDINHRGLRANRCTGTRKSVLFFMWISKNEWDYDLLFRLNKNLPTDIAVFDVIQ